MKKQEKTNVMRLLDLKGINYKINNSVDSGVISGADVAKVLNQDPDMVFKTLVTVGAGGEHYVFMVPVLKELDLKKAAKAVGEKNIQMIKSKELLPLTGFIHGGSSPIGMKKEFSTVIDETAQLFDTILFSAGKIGYQVELSPEDLFKMVDIKCEDIVS